MAKASASKSRTCCGFIPMKTGVTILTIFGILNKLSGFYGLISFDFEDKIALSVYIYSLFALIVFGVGFYGIQNDNLQIVRWYTAFYWVDCVVSTATTILFAVKWYVLTDHSLPELADDPVKLKEHDDVFRMESTVSILILVILRLVHVSVQMACNCNENMK
ncbi:Inositolphosphorylceramide synthase subunit Kei1-domain-containing protein [Radiomyces spectabilis]|uniref:Inositolphosphorylceramide synthase subunit Kei1-domain-containing protein n=1 Tax=Radiomyces spectabilis TaxID=64574 RepID=UPI00221F5C1F|nr:Inositolphosphorylceramide synthase subunit Kei1-domain-containing protein [Radiomyces spectabilis]KAI8388767.1 Inositolphosphorylceramide synthase subunit Kei1-domain-containing protein [Radiomyces spectabilis]